MESEKAKVKGDNRTVINTSEARNKLDNLTGQLAKQTPIRSNLGKRGREETSFDRYGETMLLLLEARDTFKQAKLYRNQASKTYCETKEFLNELGRDVGFKVDFEAISNLPDDEAQ